MGDGVYCQSLRLAAAAEVVYQRFVEVNVDNLAFDGGGRDEFYALGHNRLIAVLRGGFNKNLKGEVGFLLTRGGCRDRHVRGRQFHSGGSALGQVDNDAAGAGGLFRAHFGGHGLGSGFAVFVGFDVISGSRGRDGADESHGDYDKR